MRSAALRFRWRRAAAVALTAASVLVTSVTPALAGHDRRDDDDRYESRGWGHRERGYYDDDDRYGYRRYDDDDRYYGYRPHRGYCPPRGPERRTVVIVPPLPPPFLFWRFGGHGHRHHRDW